MPAALTYNAVTPLNGYVQTVDTVAVKAQKLAGFLREMEGVRSAFPTQSDADFRNQQMRELGSLYQALVDELAEDAERHGLTADPAGGWISCAGFEIQEMRVG